MPKKPSTLFIMQPHPPFSTKSWHILQVLAVSRKDQATVSLQFSVLNDAQQAGRTVEHFLPAVLAPESPLCRFLRSAFDIRLDLKQALDMSSLVGRRLQVRFDKGLDGCLQGIVAVRPFERLIQPGNQVNSKIEAPE